MLSRYYLAYTPNLKVTLFTIHFMFPLSYHFARVCEYLSLLSTKNRLSEYTPVTSLLFSKHFLGSRIESSNAFQKNIRYYSDFAVDLYLFMGIYIYTEPFALHVWQNVCNWVLGLFEKNYNKSIHCCDLFLLNLRGGSYQATQR